jgi:hypothetical protein
MTPIISFKKDLTSPYHRSSVLEGSDPSDEEYLRPRTEKRFSPVRTRPKSDGEKKSPTQEYIIIFVCMICNRRRCFLVLTLGVILSDNGLALVPRLTHRGPF